MVVPTVFYLAGSRKLAIAQIRLNLPILDDEAHAQTDHCDCQKQKQQDEGGDQADFDS